MVASGAREAAPPPSPLPDYCQLLRVTDANGHVKVMVLPKALDIDRPKRSRTTFSASQLGRLEQAFAHSRYLVGAQRAQLARALQLSETQIKVWFQNKRTKLRQTEQRRTLTKAGLPTLQAVPSDSQYSAIVKTLDRSTAST